jgi:hypothetical protein
MLDDGSMILTVIQKADANPGSPPQMRDAGKLTTTSEGWVGPEVTADALPWAAAAGLLMGCILVLVRHRWRAVRKT